MSSVFSVRCLSDYFKEVVEKDYHKYNSSISLGSCIHLAQGLFHMADWTFTYQKSLLESLEKMRFKSEKDIYPHLANKNRSFGIIRDIANASKHVSLRKPSTDIKNASDLKVESRGYGMGTFGDGRYGGVNPVVSDGNQIEYLDIHMRAVFQYWSDFTKSTQAG
ncbi:hypothetical protein SAMN04488002_1012 [Litoreibacter janthinus]|uniref:Uncharacterized protein n=1 Tax=Litoreibacter janthinus TaxID=670154 RepID=A0A1I6G7F2_9RHOB|nr:hypothetical protein SAMN04488002_1012 [Litoreibacter janthinus]